MNDDKVTDLPQTTLGDKKLQVENAVNAAREAAGTAQESPDHRVTDDGAVGLDVLEVMHRLHAVAARDQLVLLMIMKLSKY